MRHRDLSARARAVGRHIHRLAAGACAIATCALASPASSATALPTGTELGAIGARVASRVDSARFVAGVDTLTASESRQIGTPGNAAAARSIEREFRRIGLGEVRRQEIVVPVATPVFAHALLARPGGGADTVRLRSFQPNFARTNTTVPAGISGHLIYTVNGDESEYTGQEMTGSILLAEMTTQNRWRLAATLGARAVIFIESADPFRIVSAQFNTSVNFPRFYVSRAEGDRLRAWATANPGKPIAIQALQPWTRAVGHNVTGLLPGTDPVLSREVIVVTAPFDSRSPVIGLAPGAESSIGAAAQLELARVLAAERPARSVLFAALDGHHSGSVAGGREFVRALTQSFPGVLRRNAEYLRQDIRLIGDPRLAGKFPAYRARVEALDDALDRFVDADVEPADRLWDALMKARKDYRTNGAPVVDQKPEALVAARTRAGKRIDEAAARFIPAYARTLERFAPLIVEFGRLQAVFVDSLGRDAIALRILVDADSNKIRTSLAGRLAAARLGDIRKTLNKVTRMGAIDHERRRQELADQLAFVRPLLSRYPALLVDLSLTSHSDGIGLFYKGYLFDQQPDLELKRVYGDLGKRFDSYATNLVTVRDLEKFWALSDADIRDIIARKIAAYTSLRAQYLAVAPLLDKDVEVIHTYAWYHRFLNATIWFWGLLAVAFAAWRIWRRRESGGAPAYWWAFGAAGLAVSVWAVAIGADWKQTTRIYHGIDELIWERPDLLIGAQQISREDQTKIRRAADRRRPYTEVTETPTFFADNVRAAIPATIDKLAADSTATAQQLDVYARLSRFRTVPVTSLTTVQLDSLRAFIAYLGLASERRFVDGVAGTKGKAWSHYLPGLWRQFTSEVATLAGLPAIALASLDDAAPLIVGPYDRREYLDMAGAVRQVRMVAAVVSQALTDPTIPDDIALESYYSEVHGQVLFDDRTQSAVAADVPIEDAIVIADWGRPAPYLALSDRRGGFDIYGLPIDGRAIATRGATWMHAYKADADSGHIVYAMDLGNEQYAFDAKVAQAAQDWMLVVFQCASVSVTDVMDPRYFQYLAAADIFDARTDAKPWHYYSHIANGDNTFFVDPGTMVKLVFKQGMLGERALLTNVPESIRIPEHRQGLGFRVTSELLLTNTAWQAARDMWHLDEGRIETLVRHGIIDEETHKVHESVRDELARAAEARRLTHYDAYLTGARTALALESRVLPDVLATANGALKGVLFYMALLLPFAWFLERLIVGAPDIRKQALWFFAIFVAMFLLIEQVHPAFDITTAPPMVLLAFTVFALSVFVVTIIIGKFTAQMQQIRKEQQGYLSADVGRVSAMFTAFLLGVSNMRKRKVRTGLTCVTLIILTFTVLSFTSVKEYLRVNRLRLDRAAPIYNGVLIRDRYWNVWPEEMLPSIRAEMGADNVVVGRAWREAYTSGAEFFFTLEAETGRSYTLSGFVGMEPAEDQVTGIFTKAGIAGRWFLPGDLHVLVIPRSAAHALGIAENSVTGDAATAPKVRMEGIDYRIIGIVDDEALRRIRDLDGEELTSVNWALAEQQRVNRITALQQQGAQQSGGGQNAYIHFLPAQSMFMPLRAVGAGPVSVAIRTADAPSAQALIERVIPKWALEMYVGQSEGTFLYSAVGLTTMGGLGDVLIPILIAALIVLNTMLGAVYERTREIGIFSSVGLAPSHIAMLFMAEATVYAVLGAIAGYLLGQTVGQIVYQTGVLGGLTLNYSSVSAISSTLIVMITVVLSTIYPAKKASEMSVPDIARNWRLPEPDGDEWHFALPFSLMDEELEGVNAFLAQYFESHHDESSSDFYIDRVDFWADGRRFMLETMVWLAPYDLGVSELVTLISSPISGEKGLYGMSLLVTRESGDVPSWTRVNRRFVNFLRKQFLVWRSLTPAERRQFIAQGRRMFMVDGHRAVESEQPVAVETETV